MERTYKLSNNITASLDDHNWLTLTDSHSTLITHMTLNAKEIERLYMVIDRIDDTNDEAEKFRVRSK